jgi:hypothetical protein
MYSGGYNLVVTRASVAPYVLSSTPRGKKFSRIYSIMLLVVGDIPIDSEALLGSTHSLSICMDGLERKMH